MFEDIWKIMKENKLQPISEISKELICSICNKLMINACNGPCGCRYCFDCIVNYLAGENKCCPSQLKYCQIKLINLENDIVMDRPISIRISETVVKCPNKYCAFTNELSLIENHMRTCDKNPTNCPYFEIGCKNEKLNNDEMKNHLCAEIYCHTKLLLDFINNLQNELESLKKENLQIKSENKCLIENLKIQGINQEHIRKLIRTSDTNTSEIIELNEEMAALKNENRSLRNEMENLKKSLTIPNMKNEILLIIQTKSEQQTEEINKIKQNCQLTNNKQIEMKTIINDLSNQNSDLLNKLNNQNKTINDIINDKLKNIESTIYQIENQLKVKNNSGEFQWKIKSLSQQKKKTYIFSRPFYSHKHGYKMCLGIYISGDSYHIYLYLMKGEYDDNLSWPFLHGFTVDVINQHDNIIHSTRTIKYDDYPSDPRWNKPTQERNDPFWFDNINMKDLLKVIRNDEILIKCQVNKNS